ncbi:MAG: DUF4249 domain-containing protein [Bacteroidia bacterium]
MINRFYKNIFIAVLSIISFSSCRDEVILKLNTVGPVLVIDGKISNDSVPFTVRITSTTDYYSLEIPVVKTAFVTISGSNGTIDTLVFNENSGNYQSNPKSPNFIRPCLVGVSYTLNVTYNGKTFAATETCLFQNPVDSVKVIYQPKKGFFPAGYYLWEYTTEKPGKGDCYQWDLYQNDTNVFEDFYYLADDQFLEDNGQQLESDFQYPFRLGDSIIFDQFAISRRYYNFLTNIQSQTNRDGSPFSAPPTNVKGNISNGALGYFAVRNVIRKKLLAK